MMRQCKVCLELKEYPGEYTGARKTCTVCYNLSRRVKPKLVTLIPVNPTLLNLESQIAVLKSNILEVEDRCISSMREYNDDTTKYIDERISHTKDTIGSYLKEYITTLEDKVIKQEEFITTLEDKVIKQEEFITTLQDKVIKQEESITTLQDKVIKQEEYIITLDNDSTKQYTCIKLLLTLMSEQNETFVEQKKTIESIFTSLRNINTKLYRNHIK
jgi:uncharacterized coiled-coil protein SlyX